MLDPARPREAIARRHVDGGVCSRRAIASRALAAAVTAVAVASGCGGLQGAGLGSSEGFPSGDAGIDGAPVDASGAPDAAFEAAPPDARDAASDAGDASDTAIVTTDSAIADGDADVEADTSPVCASSGGDPCSAVFALSGKQTIDGSDSEFCAIAPITIDATSADVKYPSPPPSWAIASMRVRVAWSSVGLHLHFAVTDLTVAPAPAGALHFQGDSVELYVAGFDALTGAFDGTRDKGAMQIIVTRPAPDGSARAGIYYVGASTTELAKSQYISVARASGYDVEVLLPWSQLQGTSIGPGKRIGLDFAYNDRRDLTSPDQLYAGYRLIGIPAGDSCRFIYCDDRLWCTPSLH